MGSWEAFRGRGLMQGEEVSGSQFPSRGQESLLGSTPTPLSRWKNGGRGLEAPQGCWRALTVELGQRVGDDIFQDPPVHKSLCW